MPRNRKLTKVIADRIVKTAAAEAGGVLILFDDQSTLKIKTAGSASVSPGGKVRSLYETRAEFKMANFAGRANAIRRFENLVQGLAWNPNRYSAPLGSHFGDAIAHINALQVN